MAGKKDRQPPGHHAGAGSVRELREFPVGQDRLSVRPI